jgi:hypothetical protein
MNDDTRTRSAMTQSNGDLDAVSDGRRDFDFLAGEWRIANRRLVDAFTEATAWEEFESTSRVRPILGGLGNVDLFRAPTFPGRPDYEGFALRLFDPRARVWRIWWASTVGNGRLDQPVIGRFHGAVGVFECDDDLGGRSVRVRFEWTVLGSTDARWIQSFSFDGGQTFAENWIMLWTRIAGP